MDIMNLLFALDIKEVIKEYFTSYLTNNSDLTIELKNNKINFHSNHSDDWKVSLIDTGSETLTGSRIAKIKSLLRKKIFYLWLCTFKYRSQKLISVP